MAFEKKPSHIQRLLSKVGSFRRSSSNKSLPPSTSSLSSSPSSSAGAANEANIEELKRIQQKVNAALFVAYNMEAANNRGSILVRELKDVAYATADILDEHEFELLRSKLVGSATVTTQEVVSSFEDQFQIADRIDKIRVRFDWIVQSHGGLNFIEGDEDHGQFHDTKLVREHTVYGRECDKQRIVDFLLGKDVSGSEYISVMPIGGVEGVGKTTLAKFVYDDPRVFDYFPVRGWVCVPEDFDVVRLIKAIVESMRGNSCEDLGFDELKLMLNRMLRERRFLLVLDNICNVGHGLWDSLKSLFLGAETGKIIVTTQSKLVAEIFQTSTLYHLGPLLQDQSVMLFEHYAFEGRDPNDHANLVKIGEKIVDRCQGLPLAVKAIGRLLQHETDEKRWMEILECSHWELADPEDEILPALRISYLHLPAYLKPCFAYCAVFPKDHLFRKNDLVKLWMAQDMIQSDGETDVEAIGRQYFDELVMRSIFEPSTSELVSDHFVMHSLMYELTQSISIKECCLISSDAELLNVSEEVRHLYVSRSLKPQMLKEMKMNNEKQFQTSSNEPKPKSLRTILNLQVGFPNNLFLYVSRLHVLDLGLDSTEVQLDSISSLKHLRYLRLSSKDIPKLPEVVYHLYNLQTLDVESCQFLKELSGSIQNLVKLRHLQLPSVDMPSEIGQLSELRTLSPFKIGKGCSHTIRELKNLVNLNELCISQLENITDIEDANEADLENKKHLRSLILEWSSSLVEGISADSILKWLKPHAALQSLSVLNYIGPLFPRWIADPSFLKLSSVILKGSKQSKCKFLPSLGQLPSLKHLRIGSLPSVQQIRDEFCRDNLQTVKCGFPVLLRLEFKDMPGWFEWSGVLEKDFPRLMTLTINGCPKLTNWILPPRMKSLLQHAATIDKKRLLHNQFEEVDDQNDSCISFGKQLFDII